MRTLLAAVVTAALAVLVLVLASDLGTTPDAEGRDPAVPGEQAATEALEGLDDDASVAERPGRVTAPPSLTEEAGSLDAEVERITVLTARFVDGGGAPIAGARARLAGWHSWNEDGDGRRLASFGSGGVDYAHGFSSETDADGRLRFEVPPTTQTWVMLEVVAGRMHARYHADFGTRTQRHLPPLEAGRRDLGTIVLEGTGVIFGRVTSEDGAPLEGARVRFGMDAHTRTRADGTYELAHAPIGSQELEARLDGRVSHSRASVTVPGTVEVGPVDFTLREAATISGRVTDPDGRPIRGAKIVCWPEGSGRGAFEETDADGRFTAHLPQAEPYTLGITHPEYDDWGDSHDKTRLYGPESVVLDVTMERADKARLRVVAAESGEPIERFGVILHEDGGSLAPSRMYGSKDTPRPREREGGVLELKLREGVDLIVVWAEGRVLEELDVAFDEPGSRVMTVALRRGATLTGRVTRDGQGVAETRVRVAAMASGDFEDRSTVRRSVTDSEGRFRIEGIDRGATTFTASPAAGAPTVVAGLEFEPPAEVDLGDVELVPGGAIAGTVRVPAGVDPTGTTVHLGHRFLDRTATTDGDGAFRFDDVTPGRHTLMTAERPGVLAGSGKVTCEVESGETTTVEIDATGRALTVVELTLDLGGMPPEGIQVQLLPLASGPESSLVNPFTGVDLGRPDAEGRVAGAAPAFGPAKVVLFSMQLGGVEHPTARIDVRPGGPIVETVRFEWASARLGLPAGVALPPDGAVLVATERADLRRGVSIRMRDGRPISSTVASLEGGVLTVHGLTPGEWSLSATATGPSTSAGTARGPELWKLEAEVHLVTDGATDVELR